MSVGAVNKQTGDRIPTAGMPAIDNALDLTSVNPVQNAVITAALAGKADTGIVADDFDSTAYYVIGNYCIEDGKLYRFKANHSGAWAAADVEEIQIAGELSSIKSGLTNVETDVEELQAYNAASGVISGHQTASIELTRSKHNMYILNIFSDNDIYVSMYLITYHYSNAWTIRSLLVVDPDTITVSTSGANITIGNNTDYECCYHIMRFSAW